MRKSKFKLFRKSLQIICFAFIRPVFEFEDIVWNNCTQYEANELEKTKQKKTTKNMKQPI